MANDVEPSLRSIVSNSKSIAAKASRLLRYQGMDDNDTVAVRQALRAVESARSALSVIRTPRKHEAVWKRAAELCQSGVSKSEVARRLGKSRGAIQNALKQMGIEPARHGGGRRVCFNARLAVMAYVCGLSLSDTARHFGVSIRTMKRHLVVHGAKIRKQGDTTVILGGPSGIESVRDMAIDLGDAILAKKLMSLIAPEAI